MSHQGDSVNPGHCSPPVGIIANPASGKDIRRLVGHATTVDNQGKVSILRRVLVGLGAIGVREVLAMPDAQHLGSRARDGLPGDNPTIPDLHLLDLAVTGQTLDSERASRALASRGVGCVVVLGGDGTVRAASKGCGDTPLLPISTGTNNVLPEFIEGTIAGLAAGAVALGLVPVDVATYRHKWLQVSVDGQPVDRALVDVAVLAGRFVGSRAVWNANDLQQIIVTRADPTSIGISAIAGVVHPISAREKQGLTLWLGQGGSRRVLAPLGPGLVPEISIRDTRALQIGESVPITLLGPTVLALDGEREVALRKGQDVLVTLRDDGPRIVSVPNVMHSMAAARGMDRAMS